MANFSISGEYITEMAREFWYDGKYSDAMEFLENSVEGMGLEDRVLLIDYKMKLIGVGDFDFVTETEERPSDYPTYKIMLENAQSGCCGKYYEESYNEDYSEGIDIIYMFKNYEGHYVEYEDGILDCYGEPTYHDRVFSYDKDLGAQFQGFAKTIKKNKYHIAIEKWLELMPEVRYDLQNKVPFYMSVWLREHSGCVNPNIVVTNDNGATINPMLIPGSDIYVFGAGYGNLLGKTIAHVAMPNEAWEDIELFRRLCDKLFIYEDDRDDIFYNNKALLNTYYRNKNKEEYDKYHDIVSYRKNKGYDTEEVVETEEPKLEIVKDNLMKASKYAWVDRDGNYFPSQYIQHDKLADLIVTEHLDLKDVKSASFELEKLGWLRIHTAGIDGQSAEFSHMRKLSHYQLSRIRKYCDLYKVSLPTYIEF